MTNSAYLLDERVEKYRVELLTPSETITTTLINGVRGGKINFSVTGTIPSSGSLDLVVTEEIAWLSYRVKPYYQILSPTGVLLKEYPLGVYLPAAPVTKYTDTEVVQNIELYDKLLILQQDSFEETKTIKIGESVKTTVDGIITGTGEPIEKNGIGWVGDPKIGQDMVWESGVPKLQIINDLLGAINYYPLRCNNIGVFYSTPYTEPLQRPIAFEFEYGTNSIYLPEFTKDFDEFSLPNKFIAISKTTTGDEEPLVERIIHATGSKYSVAERGRTITKVEKNIDLADGTVEQKQAALLEIARKKLIQELSTTSKVTISHPFVPIELDNRVAVRNQLLDENNFSGVVESMEIDMSAGELMTTTLREVKEWLIV